MLLHLCLGISAPAPLRWRASTPGAPRRAILPPRMGAENRMASHGLLYEGWGKEGMENLNTSCSVLDKGYEHEMNRYEITLMVARRAKEAAYQQTQDEDESLMTNAVGRKKQRLSHVMQAIREIEVESDASGSLSDGIADDLAFPAVGGVAAAAAAAAAEQASAAAAAADPAGVAAAAAAGAPAPADPPPTAAGISGAAALGGVAPSGAPTSLDGDGGAAAFQRINDELLAAAEQAEQAAVGDAVGGDAAAFSELLEVDDEFGSEELAELFGGLDLDGSGGSIEAGGMHPGDNG